MARALRIERPGGDHVSARVNERKAIYLTDADGVPAVLTLAGRSADADRALPAAVVELGLGGNR